MSCEQPALSTTPVEGRERAFHTALAEAVAATETPIAMIHCVEPAIRRPFRVVAVGIDGQPFVPEGVPLGVGPIGRCAETGEVVFRVEAARLDGVVLAARTTANEINNDLAVVVGADEVLLLRTRDQEKADERLLKDIITGAERAAQHVQQLQSVVRLQERQFGDLPPVIDLDHSIN